MVITAGQRLVSMATFSDEKKVNNVFLKEDLFFK